mmetsp:Transcript_114004/g.354028  ORF Transcript_114004/g.354028 Transcript_114004/m.354028 type:complete len:318 (-) Transcript_114004:8-961(-)
MLVAAWTVDYDALAAELVEGKIPHRRGGMEEAGHLRVAPLLVVEGTLERGHLGYAPGPLQLGGPAAAPARRLQGSEHAREVSQLTRVRVVRVVLIGLPPIEASGAACVGEALLFVAGSANRVPAGWAAGGSGVPVVAREVHPAGAAHGPVLAVVEPEVVDVVREAALPVTSLRAADLGQQRGLDAEAEVAEDNAEGRGQQAHEPFRPPSEGRHRGGAHALRGVDLRHVLQARQHACVGRGGTGHIGLRLGPLEVLQHAHLVPVASVVGVQCWSPLRRQPGRGQGGEQREGEGGRPHASAGLRGVPGRGGGVPKGSAS